MEYHRYQSSKNVEFCQAIGTSHIFPKHCHESVYILGLMDHGASYCVGEEDAGSIVQSNEAFMINPGQVHSGVPITSEGISYSLLSVDTSFMGELASDLLETDGVLPEFNKIVDSNKAINQKLRELFQILQTNQDNLQTESELNEALSVLINHYSSIHSKPLLKGEEKKRLKLAKDYLSSNLSEKMTLSEVAEQVKLSQYYFTRLFKKKTGISPHAYRTQLRLDAAKNLLKKGRNFSDIAVSTGFTDQSHFTNTFKAYMGITPGQYLK